jgi:hypothetical protein
MRFSRKISAQFCFPSPSLTSAVLLHWGRKTIKPITGGRVHDDVFQRDVVHDGFGSGDLVGAAQIDILLKHPVCGSGWPENQHGVIDPGDGQ